MSFLSTIEKATSTRYLRYSFADPLQSASVITDATGQTIQETIDYMPYGAVRVDSKSNGYGGTKKGYIQSERDSSGLNYMNARYYEGVKGKFVSQDPVSRDIGTILLPSPSNSVCASNWSGNTMSGNSSTCGSEKNGTKPGYLINVNGGALPYSQLTLLTDPQMLNSYSYGRNNPITMSDPSGLWAVAITLNLGAEIGAGPGIGGTVGGGWHMRVAMVQEVRLAQYGIQDTLLVEMVEADEWGGKCPVQNQTRELVYSAAMRAWGSVSRSVVPQIPLKTSHQTE